ncbi:MAG: hypothetical protein BYD32DRAFT_416903 [Podila humilis]|nr:MAG: hypothetical protein BYD32DRAFT_416903 [Podila humilis]
MHNRNQFGAGNFAGRPVTPGYRNPHINLRDPGLPNQTALNSDMFTIGGITRPRPAPFPYALPFINYRPVAPADAEKTQSYPKSTYSNNITTSYSHNTTSYSHKNGPSARNSSRKSIVSSPVRHSRAVPKKQPYPKSTKKTKSDPSSLADFRSLPSFQKASSTVGTGSLSFSRPDRITMTVGPSSSSPPSSSPSSLKSLVPSPIVKESSVNRPNSIGRIDMVCFGPVADRRAHIPLNSSSKDKVGCHGLSVSTSDAFMDTDTEMDMATSCKQDVHAFASKVASEPTDDVHHPITAKRPLPDPQLVSRHRIISMTTPLSSSRSTYPGPSPGVTDKVYYVDDQYEPEPEPELEPEECLITKIVCPTQGIVYYNSAIDIDNRAATNIKDTKPEEQDGPRKAMLISRFFHSDGCESRFPQHQRIRELRTDDEKVQEWLSQAMVATLPQGYRLFEVPKTRKCLLFGHAEGAFKRPEQFTQHALWLASDNYASFDCSCHMCRVARQEQKQEPPLLPFTVEVDKGTGAVSYDLSTCTYSKDSQFHDCPPKIKQSVMDIQDLAKNEMMDMTMEEDRDDCAPGPAVQLLPSTSPLGQEHEVATLALSFPYATSHAKQDYPTRQEHEWSPHALGRFFPVQTKKHKVPSLRQMIAQGNIHM